VCEQLALDSNVGGFLINTLNKILITIKNHTHMRNATMIWSSMDHERDNILVLDNTNAATRLFHKIFSETEKKRLVITRNKYFYAPSEEYKSYVIRIKNIR
jgi:hypothetical protein